MYCPKCGEPLVDGGRFCKRCGAEVIRLQTGPAGNAAPQPNMTSGPAQPEYVYDPVAMETQQQTPPRRGRGLIIAACCFALVAAFVAALVILNPFGDRLPKVVPSGNGGNEEQPVGQVGGNVVQAYNRPSLLQAASLVAALDITPKVEPYTVNSDFSNVINYEDFKYYIEQNETFRRNLLENGFVVSLDTYSAGKHSGEFFHVYEDNRYNYIPNFVTCDSMMHTYHLYFAHLLKETERTYLVGSLSDISELMLGASEEQLDAVSGTAWESAAKRNVTFFAIGRRLLDPSAELPSSVSDVAQQELDNIMAAEKITTSPLFGIEEDYSQYKPRGYYEGDERLERYFRGMMWYGRMSFLQNDEDLARSACLMTLAMQGDALGKWEGIYAVTSFFAGASDDLGYYEYRPVIDEAYGSSATVSDLVENEGAWGTYRELLDTMRPPMINSIPIPDDEEEDTTADDLRAFRFMGQRFSFDETIFQALCYRSVKENSADDRRMLPNALDLPAAMGSQTAYDLLRDKGAFDYANYEDNMQALRSALDLMGDDTWTANLYNEWLYTLDPLLEEKGEGYPPFMQSDAWARKDLVTYLGSYTELKHDTILYTKQMMAEMGGLGIDAKDDRGYVEAEPLLFARLTELCKATREGLARYGMLTDEDSANLELLEDLAGRLRNIATKELTGESLADSDFDLIRTYGGQIEHFWYEVYKNETDKENFTAGDFPAALVADVATDPNGSCLELATGNPSKIFVIVEVEGSLRIATGTVFSYYEFTQPLSDRLTDTTWRQMQGIELNDYGQYNTPEKVIVDWAQDFSYDSRGSF